MKLKKLQLENFRNYHKYDFIFPKDKDFIVLVGENGKGKTNLLEAIYTLSLGRSFRTLKKDNLVEWKQDYFRCKSEIENEEESTTIEVFYANKPQIQRNFKKNDVNLKNSEFVGNLLTVLFHPEDLNMLYLSPSYRRKYMDILLSQCDRRYLYNLSKYKKILKQRSALLQQIRKEKYNGNQTKALEADLSAWDTEMAQHGSYIVEKRGKLVGFLAENLQALYQNISNSDEEISIKYMSKLQNEDFEQALLLRRQRDIMEGQNTLGPHRDDLIFLINNLEMDASASRGEFRSLLLAIKLSEIKYIKEMTEISPVLLLDDVFSELDKNRQKALIKAIKGCQTIITTTDSDHVQELKDEGSIEFVKV